MYMSRDIMHCKPGKAKDMVERFKKLSDVLESKGYSRPRVYTDVSGEHYWTVIMEQDLEHIEDLAEMARNTQSDPEFSKVMKDYHEFIVEGRREFFKLE